MDEQRLRDAHAVFCEVFQSNMPYETFRHKHLDNPNLDSSVVNLVDYQSGIPAGTNSFMGDILLVDQQKLSVLQSCDTAVQPAFRGCHIFSKLIQQAVSISQHTQTALVYGFPNEKSCPGFLKLNFHELGKLETYAAIPRPVHLLCRKLLRKASALPAFQETAFNDPKTGLIWQMSLRCPFTEQDISVINERPGIHLRRSRAFFQWKIDYLPEGETAYLCVRRHDQLLAYFVLRRHANGTCEVCDWMVTEEREAACRIIRTAVRFLRRFCDLVSVSMVNPTGEEPSLLTGGGFFRKKVVPQPFLIYPTSDTLTKEELARLKDLRSWTLRSIDGDTILNG